ncbi:hypothetical protein FSP39_005662 [Pinctada imbricata]|uniref:YqaJ viral recombinase domain-containing protein n=1 Tax=Pinctada imbricata TaxID=66713 RepID=A0AA88XEQ0_PINIB|nr:hypothetical protein FSP39_005662 [Pinctada imbricata]
MAESEFSLLKLPDLQTFLAKRGITTNNIRKDKLVELCEAVNHLNLPLDPDFTTQCPSIDLKEKLRHLPLPDPFVEEGFTDDFSDIPNNFTLLDIFNYLLYRTSDYDKKKLKAYKSCEDYRLFVDGHVESLLFNSCGDSELCVFRAKVKPTQRDKTYLNTKFYHLMDGACRHVSAALYELDNFEVKSVTDGENKWMKRPRSHDCPVPIKSLRIVKARYSSLNEDKENNLEVYDPRFVDDRNSMDISDFTKQLQQLHPDTQAMDILDADIKPSETERNETPQSLPYSIKEQVKEFLVQEKPASSSIHVVQNVDSFREHLGQFSQDIVNTIEKDTRGQFQNSTWKTMRYGMLTASNFHKICNAVDRRHCPPSLLNSILSKYETDLEVPSLQWGRKKEPVARDLYTRASRINHKKAMVEEKGLYVMNDCPFIGCSVDGIFSCKCHGMKILEIKCPYSTRNLHPKEVAIQKGCCIDGNKSVVTENCDYYHQLQGQMGLYGIPSCDLVIYTQKGIHVSHLEFNKIFFNEMMKKLQLFLISIYFNVY